MRKMLPHYHISISRFYPIIWSHWSPHSSSPLLAAPPDHSIDQSCRHGNLKRPKVGVQWAVVGGAGAVTDRDVVWGRGASWSPQITMFWLVTRCNTLSRGVTGTNIIVISPVYIVCQYLQTTCWVWELYTWGHQHERNTHIDVNTKLTLSGTYKELL